MSSFRSSASAAAAPLPALYSKTQLKGVKGLDNDSDNDLHSPSPADIDTPTSLASKRNSADEFDSDALAEDDCKYDDEELLKTKTPLLTGNDPTAKREEIRAYFHKTYSLYEKLFDVLANDQTFYMQPEKLRHPLIFYFAHTSVFFINKLRLAGLLNQRINEHMESTCAIGVDEMSWDDLRPSNYVWPSVDEARKYRDMARVVVDDLISSLPLQLPITWDSPFWVILMGCEHERIHLETSSVLFRQLPIEQVKPVPMWESCKQFRSRPTEVPKNKLLPVPGGKVVTGKSLDNGDTYGWDNEYGHFETTTEPIQASQFLCSNAEFFEFVQDGGYEDLTLWGEEGARFIQFRKATCPVFWVPIESETADGKPQVTYKYRTMTRVIEMPWDWPVDCNYIEAKAFCAWKNRKRAAAGVADDGLTVRLPSEAEYWQLREHAFPAQATDRATGETRINDQPYWKEAPGNINMEHGASSCPIDAFEFEHGFYDIIGNVWQWTETPIMPFRGFRFHPLYDDFSVPTFDTRHNIFTGGSWASTGNEATRFARYAFRRHFYQHAGFRYVIGKPLEAAPQETAMCETDPAVTHMMDAQYNDAGLATIAASVGLNHLAENYAVQFARYAVEVYKTHNHSSATGARALDLGCATGRSTFELAKLTAAENERSSALFEAIFGLDFSTRFIRIAAQLQFEHHAEYAFKNEGELTSYHSIESKPVSAITTSSSISAPNSTTIDAALARTVSSTPSILDLDLESRGMQQVVEFVQGDACNLASKHRDYSLLLCSNVLEFMYDPRKFLADVHTRVRDGGLLILASTFDWNESYTPRCNWVGGFKDATGETLKSLEGVRAILAKHFNELPQLRKELPLIEKSNSRSFALKFSQITVWQRKSVS